MRRVVFVLLLTSVALACIAYAQKPQRPREILDLVALANAAPPEFAADALIRIADSDKVADPAWKRELLEQALTLAPAAQYKVKRPNVGGPGDAMAGYLSYAYELEMDTLSLQWRALKVLDKTDPARARKLLHELPPLHLDPLGCREAMVYDVGPFYAAVAEIARDQPLAYVEPFVIQINSHVQVGPVMQLIASRKSQPRELDRLTGEFLAALAQIDHDPRAFRYAVQDAEGFARTLRDAGIQPQAFLTAYGEYLDRHMSARQCHGPEQREMTDEQRQRFRANSLERMRKDMPLTIGLWDIVYKQRELQYDDDARPMETWQPHDTPEYSKLMKGAMGLRGTADKKGIEWQTALTDFRNALDEWKEQSEASPRAYFYEKCLLEMMMLEAVPRIDVPLRTATVDNVTAFLASSPIRVTSRIEWWRQARGLLENSPEAAAAFARSPDPVMQLYVSIDRTLGSQKSQ